MKMTGVDIDNMAPGHEMDALIAEKILGQRPGADFSECPKYGYTAEIGTVYPDPYSTNISFTLEMESELSKMSAHIQVGYVSRLYELLGIPFNKPMPLSTEESLKLIRATPEQRCRAALKAVMGVY